MKYNDKIIWKVTKYNWISINESSHIDNTKARKSYMQILLKSRNLFVHIHHFKRKNNKQTHPWNLFRLDLSLLSPERLFYKSRYASQSNQINPAFCFGQWLANLFLNNEASILMSSGKLTLIQNLTSFGIKCINR